MCASWRLPSGSGPGRAQPRPTLSCLLYPAADIPVCVDFPMISQGLMLGLCWPQGLSGPRSDGIGDHRTETYQNMRWGRVRELTGHLLNGPSQSSWHLPPENNSERLDASKTVHPHRMSKIRATNPRERKARPPDLAFPLKDWRMRERGHATSHGAVDLLSSLICLSCFFFLFFIELLNALLKRFRG